MTNDRRKTFATPLEFWQWAIMEPGKRKAKFNYRGGFEHAPVYIEIASVGFPRISHGWCHFDNSRFPMIAVEDEHGVIEEEKPLRPDAELKAIKYWDKKSVDLMIALIDERIAAATVERALGCGWFDFSEDIRLKPKGDA